MTKEFISNDPGYFQMNLDNLRHVCETLTNVATQLSITIDERNNSEQELSLLKLELEKEKILSKSLATELNEKDKKIDLLNTLLLEYKEHIK